MIRSSGLVSHARYLGCDDHQTRRDLNQAVFDSIYIHDDEIVGCNLQPLFRPMLDNTAAALTEDSQQTNDHPLPDRPGILRYFSRTFLNLERPLGLLPWERKNLRPSQTTGSNNSFLVALTGIEPVTLGL